MVAFFIILGIVGVGVLIYFLWSKNSDTKFDNFFENVKKIAQKAQYNKVTKEEVLEQMKPHKPAIITTDRESTIRFYSGCSYDDCLAYNAWNVSNSYGTKSVTTQTSEAWFVFYFKNGALVNIQNLSQQLK